MDINPLRIAIAYLKVFKDKDNCNTGNVYEIALALNFLRKMGLTNDNIDSLLDIINYLESLGKGNTGLSKVIEYIKKQPVLNNLCFNGKKVVDLVNLTQDDGCGTADIKLVYDDGTSEGFSITEGTGKIGKSGLSKVITNAGIDRMGCKECDTAIRNLEKTLSKDDKDKYCVETYGADKTKWPKKCKFPAGIKVQSDCAELLGTTIAGLPVEKRREIMNDILCITKMPADYCVYINKKSYLPTFYRIIKSRIQKDTWDPKIKVDGVYLNTYCGDILISKSQVKYNNGVGTSMRKVNVGAIMDKIFELKEIK